MKKTIYNLLFLTILFHIFLDASDNQAEVLRLQTENEETWVNITDAVFSHPNFPQSLQPLRYHDPEIHRIINKYFTNICNTRQPGVGAKKTKPLNNQNPLKDRPTFDVVTEHMVKEIIKKMKLYALRLKHQQTKKSEPTEAELAQAAEEFAAAAVAADKAMQDLLAEEAQKRSIAGATKENNGNTKRNPRKKK